METNNGLTNDQILDLLNHENSADYIYREFYDRHSDLIKGMLMQFYFTEGVAKMKVYNKTDWNNVIYKKDYPAYYILTRTIESNKNIKDNSGNIIIIMEPYTINLRLDSIKTHIDKDEYPNNAIIAFFMNGYINHLSY